MGITDRTEEGKNNKTPLCCVECCGSGVVHIGFDNHNKEFSIIKESCKPCKGKGIIWG